MNTTIHITTDAQLKVQAQKVAKAMGLNLSLVLNNLLKEFIKTQSIRFTTEKTLSSKLEDQWISDIEESKDEPSFTNSKDLINYCLNAKT